MNGYMRKPAWLKIKLPQGNEIKNYSQVRQTLQELKLCTVCEEAKCPNINECWGNATATFMILGDTCTRSCRFCSVKSAAKGNAVDEKEPERIAKAAVDLKLKYIVITSVDRDDLPDYGAEHFKKCVDAIKKNNPKAKVELLIPDFNGKIESLDIIIGSNADVLGHNIEVVERLQGIARDRRANYAQSLKVLKYIKEKSPKILTKSSLLLGLGESEEEILQAMDDLRENNVDIITFGQYLQPSAKNIEVKEYIPQEKFEYYARKAKEKGFLHVASGAFVRSSYLAEKVFNENGNYG